MSENSHGPVPSPLSALRSTDSRPDAPRSTLYALREWAGILVPLLLVVAAVAVALRLLNGMPALVQILMAPPTPVPFVLSERLEYPDLEAAERDLGLKVATPRYFPSYLAWPAASVRGQREPVRVVSLLFRSAGGQPALQIREIFWPGENLPFPVPEPMVVLERREVQVNGAPGELLLGQGQGETPVNQLRWRVGAVHLVATAVYPAEELLRIADSIHPGDGG